MIGRYVGTHNLHSHVIKVFVCAMLAGCATSRTPILDQDFGKSVQLSKDIQRIPVDPSNSQSTSSFNSRELRVYTDKYIEGGLNTGNALVAPITGGGGK